MFAAFSRTFSRLAVAGVSMGLACAAAVGANIPNGGTLDPIPGGTLAAGATQEFSVTKPFAYTTYTTIIGPGGVPLHLPHSVHGAMTQRVYRMADNTITFAYTVSNDSDSQADVGEFTVRDFSEYTTDIISYSGIDTIFAQTVSSATRAADGNSIQFVIDSGISAGNHTRTVYIDTNATAFATPGRFVPVSTRASVCTNGDCLSIYGFAYPVEDSTPPVVSLATPASLASVCSPTQITGRAYDPNGFDSYDLEYASNPNGPWTLITSSSTAVSSTGPLGSWNTNSPVNVPQGYYFLRLTAANTTGMTSSVTNIVFVDKQFDTVEVRSPGNNQILGGGVCFDGTVNDNNDTTAIAGYTIQYAPLPAGSPFTNVNPATPTYTQQVINDGLGSWITSTGPTAVPDGNYRVRVTGTDLCGNSRSVTRDLTIDNTAPVAVITAPNTCGNVTGQVAITGTISDAHLAAWVLQYSGGSSHGWVTIASGNNAVNNGTIATWNTTGLPACAYTLRLVASDSSGINCSGNTNQTEYHVSVAVGCPGDFNRSGAVSVQDIFDYLTAYFNGCP